MTIDHTGKIVPRRYEAATLTGEPMQETNTTPTEGAADLMDDELYRLTQSLNGYRGDDQQRIAIEGLKWLDTLLRKNNDYGGSAWKVPRLVPHLSAGDAILVRMTDKVERIERLQQQGAEVAESLEDTVSDLGSYALLWLARPK